MRHSPERNANHLHLGTVERFSVGIESSPPYMKRVGGLPVLGPLYRSHRLYEPGARAPVDGRTSKVSLSRYESRS